ncbi:MAG: substrate-binding domain-containing protein [Pseudomonadota bacterium]
MTTTDGFASFEGELVGFDGTLFTIETSVGALTIPADEVVCTGAGCPEGTGAALAASPAPPAPPSILEEEDTSGPARLTVQAETPALASFVRALAAAYAAETGAALNSERTERGSDLMRIAAGEAAFDLEIAAATASGQAFATPDVLLRAQPSGALSSSAGAVVLGLDALVAVTAPDLPVAAIALADLARIYAGELTDWSQLGGPSRPIVALTGPEGSDWRALVEAMVLEPAARTLSASAVAIESPDALPEALARFPGGIGLALKTEVDASGALALGGVCGPAVVPDAFAIASGTYPLSRTIVAEPANPEALNTGVEDFLDWAISPAGQAAIGRLAPGAPLAQKAHRGGGRERATRLALAAEYGARAETATAARTQAAAMVGTLLVSERLSTTLRFTPGTTAPTLQAEGDLARLAALLAEGSYDGAKVLLLGFDQSPGSAVDAQITRSRALAETVLARLQASAPDLERAHGIRFETRGFGPAAPLACVDAPSSATRNARVEVWLARGARAN